MIKDAIICICLLRCNEVLSLRAGSGKLDRIPFGRMTGHTYKAQTDSIVSDFLPQVGARPGQAVLESDWTLRLLTRRLPGRGSNVQFTRAQNGVSTMPSVTGMGHYAVRSVLTLSFLPRTTQWLFAESVGGKWDITP